MRLAALAALAVVTPADLAHAGSHFGSHESEGDALDFKGKTVHRCAGDVVGFPRCGKFAAWSTDLNAPQLSLELGPVVVRQFASRLEGQAGTARRGDESFVYRVAGHGASPRPRDTAVLGTMRANVGWKHGVYLAGELGFGRLLDPQSVVAELATAGAASTATLSPYGCGLFDALAIAGVQRGNHVARLGVELAGGGESVWYRFERRDQDGLEVTAIKTIAPIAEARLRGELWLSPRMTGGVMLGTSLVERSAWMGGVILGVHRAAFRN